jgi:hypothetical protein
MSNEIEIDIRKTISEAREKFEEEIQKFYHAHLDIVRSDISKEEKTKRIKELIDEYTKAKNDETSRDSQREHKPNDPPLARNRMIIQAEIQQHKLNFDSNGSFDSKENWQKKHEKLEAELKNSVN